MTRHSSELRLPARPLSRGALATVAACCILLLTLIPAATARPVHPGKGAHTPAPAQTTSAPEAEQTPAGAGPATTSAPAGATVEGATGGSHNAGQGEAASAPRGQAKRSARRARHEAAEQREAATSAGAPTQQEATPQQEGPTQQSAGAQQQTARARHKGTRESKRHKEGSEPGRHKEGAGETEGSNETGKHGKQGEPTPTTPAAGDPAGSATPAPAPLVEPATSIAASAASVATTAATTTAAIVTPTVAYTSIQPRSSRRSRASRSASGVHGRVSGAVLSTRQLAAARTAGAIALSNPRTRGSGARVGARGTRRDIPSALPLTTTITRIVDVVPTPMRVLIAALLPLALALGVRSRMAARRTRRLERQRLELLEDVGLLQAALLPVPPARLGPVGTSVAYKPAAGPGAGGDFYDVFALEDGQVAVIVGDVSGHGRHALPHTALVRFTLRAYLEAGLSPRDAVQKAGTVLERQLGDQFVTVVAATYNPRERALVYACAGHPPPVVLGTDGVSGALQPVTVCSSPPIGVGLRTGIRQTVVSVPGRSQICFYTDGVTEARVGRELFGAERLLVTHQRSRGPGNCVERP